MIGIYKFTNKFNRKVYIGKASNIEKRYKGHLRNAKYNREGYFYNALRKYGPEGFVFEVLIECPLEKLDYWETFYIKYYNANNHEYGYNETEGGEGITNPSEEERKRRSDYAIEHYNGEGNPFYGHNHTEEGKINISIGTKNGMTPDVIQHMKDVRWTDEKRTAQSELMSEQRKGKPSWNSGKKGILKTINNGTIVKQVKIEELDFYLSNGWEVGGLKKNKPSWNSGKKGVYHKVWDDETHTTYHMEKKYMCN